MGASGRDWREDSLTKSLRNFFLESLANSLFLSNESHIPSTSTRMNCPCLFVSFLSTKIVCLSCVICI